MTVCPGSFAPRARSSSPSKAIRVRLWLCQGARLSVASATTVGHQADLFSALCLSFPTVKPA